MTETSSASPRRQRGLSQKAMLSKALQKANTAVLLDNAANFEGAIEAYDDACQLLQLVMLRSSGGDDEKTKLQEIVRNLGAVREVKPILLV
jgi:chromosome condensin MukBEF MukE localization factor